LSDWQGWVAVLISSGNDLVVDVAASVAYAKLGELEVQGSEKWDILKDILKISKP